MQLIQLLGQQSYLLILTAGEYCESCYMKMPGLIPHRIAAVPPFPCLRRFPEGRGFKQWTGNDSKALMKVRSWPLFKYFSD
jgi:hypothetical protein